MVTSDATVLYMQVNEISRWRSQEPASAVPVVQHVVEVEVCPCRTFSTGRALDNSQ
jgi:hypothetical protein